MDDNYKHAHTYVMQGIMYRTPVIIRKIPVGVLLRPEGAYFRYNR